MTIIMVTQLKTWIDKYNYFDMADDMDNYKFKIKKKDNNIAFVNALALSFCYYENWT